MRTIQKILLVLAMTLSVSSSTYSQDWSMVWHPNASGEIKAGTLEIWLGEPGEFVFARSGYGGLTINGLGTSVLSDQLQYLVVHGSSGDDVIDLTHIHAGWFPNLQTKLDNSKYTIDQDYRTRIEAHGGNNTVLCHDMGSYVQCEAGKDIVVGGKFLDYIWGGLNDDILVSQCALTYLGGGEGNDILIYTHSGNADGGPGDDVYILAGMLSSVHKPSIRNKSIVSIQDSLAQNRHFTITDSSGIDTLDFGQLSTGIDVDLNLYNTSQVFTETNDTLDLHGVFEYVIGTPFDDVIRVDPDPDAAITIDGGGCVAGDTLEVDKMGQDPQDDGAKITVTGYQPVTYQDIGECVYSNTAAVSLESEFLAPDRIQLHQNYPNPFNPETRIAFTLPKSTDVVLEILDVRGRIVTALTQERCEAGTHTVTFNAGEHPTGVFFYRLSTPESVLTRRMLLVK